MRLGCTIAWLLAGCVPAHVAAVELEGATGDGGQTQSSGSADPSSGGECELPELLPDCDAAADPLRAPEFACHDGISAAAFETVDDDAWRRANEFGNAFWVSDTSDAVLVLSTGRLPLPNSAGQVAVDASAAQQSSVDNGNPDGVQLPAPIVIAPGSAEPYVDCDGVGDCSHSLSPLWAAAGTANDLVWLRFDADVPANAHGYVARVALLTAEYPEQVAMPASDAFVWWTTSEAFTGNLATLDRAPATVAGLEDLLRENTGGHPMLIRTGNDGTTGDGCTVEGVDLASCPVGAATGWMTLRGPAVPGERLTIAVALFDVGDALLDTTLVLDGWTWTCGGCIPGETCGLRRADG